MQNHPRSIRRLGIVAILMNLLTTAVLGNRVPPAQPADNVILNQATVVTDSDEPAFVQFAVEELASYLKESTGADVSVVTSPPSTKQTQILVGRGAVQKAASNAMRGEKLSEEGYLLKCVEEDGVPYVVVTGATPRGTKLALAALAKAVQVEGKTAFVPRTLDVLTKPAYARRGMHLNGWPLNYPYSFRNWREEDWQHYLDILSCQGINLFYLWPFIEIMPLPLSKEDRAYLEECRRLVDYAQKNHGMEVWIMQCANRVARDNCGVADPRVRPYWRPSQEDLNPGKPEDLKSILASREAMYRILDNVDGVCNIDSDPGFFPGSSLSDYVKVLQECRALIDRHNTHGKQAKLVNWMLWGWGRAQKIEREGLAEHQLGALRALKQGLKDPFWLISGQFPEFLPMCRDEGLVARTVLLPYGVIEGEPAYPQTQVRIDAARAVFEGPDAQCPDVAGFMGNVQTPILQFPNLYYVTSVMSDFEYRKRSEPEVLVDLSGHLYPDHKRLLADCFLALKDSDPAKVESLAGRLHDLVQHDCLGRLGLFGRKLFSDHRIVATSLELQLRLRAAHQRLVGGITPGTSRDECARLLRDYFDSYIAWDLAHGWHQLWGWNTWPLPDLPLGTVAEKLRTNLADDQAVDACFDEVARRLSKYDAAIVEQGCIAPLKGAISALAPPAGAVPER